MKLVDVPTRFNIPFANSAGGGYVRAVPEASQVGVQNGAASLTDGFPPLNFLPVGAGGVPPFGQDTNGILRQITQWSRWQGAGNATTYNSAFSTAIGGYPLGAMLASATSGVLWLNTVDDNTSDPDASGAGWIRIASVPFAQSGSGNYAAATGTANALVVTLTPAPAAIAAGFVVRVKAASVNTGATTINVNGLGVKTVVTQNGQALVGGEIPAGSVLPFVYDGTRFILSTFSLPSNAAGFLSNDGTGVLSWSSAGSIVRPTALLADQRTAGSTGDSLTTGTWVTRTLNTDLYASSGVMTLSANKFTMLKNAFCQFQSVAYACGRYKHRIYNETDSVVAGYSTPGYTGNTATVDTQTSANGSCNLVTGKTYRLDTWVQLGGVNAGGINNTDGSPQVFSTVEIYPTS